MAEKKDPDDLELARAADAQLRLVLKDAVWASTTNPTVKAATDDLTSTVQAWSLLRLAFPALADRRDERRDEN